MKVVVQLLLFLAAVVCFVIGIGVVTTAISNEYIDGLAFGVGLVVISYFFVQEAVQ